MRERNYASPGEQDGTDAQTGPVDCEGDDNLSGELESGPHRLEIVEKPKEVNGEGAAEERQLRTAKVLELAREKGHHGKEREAERNDESDTSQPWYRFLVEAAVIAWVEDAQVGRQVAHRSCQDQREYKRGRQSY